MVESLLIALREGFEAALVVTIVLAVVRRNAPHQARAVWIGTALAVATAVVAGLALHATIDGLEGVARLRVFALICIVAAALLTWMIFWMRSHGRSMKHDLEGKAGAALATGSGLGLAVVAFTAVAREGLETALFLISSATNADGGQVVLGTLIGLAIACVLGWLVYQGSTRFDTRRFFMVTGLLLILFAAGLLDRAVLYLQEAGDLSSINNAVYNLTQYRWLTLETQTGRFLAGIFGWDPRPSFEQVAIYLAYAIPVGLLFYVGGRTPSRPSSPSSSSSPSTESTPSTPSTPTPVSS
jgi:high-affinity iron transporter